MIYLLGGGGAVGALGVGRVFVSGMLLPPPGIVRGVGIGAGDLAMMLPLRFWWWRR
ncbi:MAG: hypothetical protein V7775_10100 [Sulfitobacter sp.]